MTTSVIGAPVVKDCHVCHGTAVVRVRLHDEDGKPYGKVRVITCPECKGRGSWMSRDRRVATDTPSATSGLLDIPTLD